MNVLPNNFFDTLTWYNGLDANDNLFSLHRFLTAHGFRPIYEKTHDGIMIWENCYSFQVSITVDDVGNLNLTF